MVMNSWRMSMNNLVMFLATAIFCFFGFVVWRLYRDNKREVTGAEDRELNNEKSLSSEIIENTESMSMMTIYSGEEKLIEIKREELAIDLPEAKKKLIPINKNRWGAILDVAQPCIEVIAQKGTQQQGCYQLNFAPNIERRIKMGELKQVVGPDGIRAMVVDKAGKIRGQGVLAQVKNKIKPMAIAKAATGVVLAIAAEANMEEIRKKLVDIAEGVDSIKEDRLYAERGEIFGSIEYIGTISDTVLKGQLNDIEKTTYLVKLEDIEARATEIMRKILENVESDAQKMDERKLPGKIFGGFDREKHARMEKWLKEYEKNKMIPFFLLNKLRMTVLEMQEVISQQPDRRIARISNLDNSWDKLLKKSKVFFINHEEYYKKVSERMNHAHNHIFSTKKTFQARLDESIKSRQNLISSLDKENERAVEGKKVFENNSGIPTRMLSENVNLFIEINENGDVVQISAEE